MQNEINHLAEFKDKNKEKNFYNYDVKSGLRISGNIALIFSIINLLFVIPDYLYLQYSDITVIIYHSLIPRLIILIMAIAVYILLKKAKNKIIAIKSTIIFVVLMYLLHEYIAMHFAPVDLIYEVLDLIYITFGLFIIPNRWITNIGTSVFLVVIFMVLSPWTIPTMSEGTKVIITIYLFSQTLIIGALMYRINIQKRLNYLQQLELEILAETDALTQSSNRAACDKTLERLCSTHREFSLLLIDLDDFKQVNDLYGHVAGDKVIVKIVDTIKKVIRQDDIIARWGGEEFIVILPRTTQERAMEIAGRIKENIMMTEHDNKIHRITASFGVTTYVPGDDTNSIINRADQLLYIAKKQGKNRVVAG